MSKKQRLFFEPFQTMTHQVHPDRSHNRKRTLMRVAFGKRVQEKRFNVDLHTTYLSSVERIIALENIGAIAKASGCSPRNLMLE